MLDRCHKLVALPLITPRPCTLTVFDCDSYASSKLAECAIAALGAFNTAKEDMIGVGEAAGTPCVMEPFHARGDRGVLQHVPEVTAASLSPCCTL